MFKFLQYFIVPVGASGSNADVAGITGTSITTVALKWSWPMKLRA